MDHPQADELELTDGDPGGIIAISRGLSEAIPPVDIRVISRYPEGVTEHATRSL